MGTHALHAPQVRTTTGFLGTDDVDVVDPDVPATTYTAPACGVISAGLMYGAAADPVVALTLLHASTVDDVPYAPSIRYERSYVWLCPAITTSTPPASRIGFTFCFVTPTPQANNLILQDSFHPHAYASSHSLTCRMADMFGSVSDAVPAYDGWCHMAINQFMPAVCCASAMSAASHVNMGDPGVLPTQLTSPRTPHGHQPSVVVADRCR